jgi:hypothetical protein
MLAPVVKLCKEALPLLCFDPRGNDRGRSSKLTHGLHKLDLSRDKLAHSAIIKSAPIFKWHSILTSCVGCVSCNQSKGAKTVSEFRDWLNKP